MRNDLVLKDINLSVKAGQTIAIVGKSGGGKTTLVNLIPRFYDVTGGAILIDGRTSVISRSNPSGPSRHSHPADDTVQ